MNPGDEFMHIKWGRIMVVYSHPHDGACLVIERQETTEPDCDKRVFDSCERSDLIGPLPDRKWPYLGFTSPTEG